MNDDDETTLECIARNYDIEPEKMRRIFRKIANELQTSGLVGRGAYSNVGLMAADWLRARASDDSEEERPTCYDVDEQCDMVDPIQELHGTRRFNVFTCSRCGRVDGCLA